MFTIFVESWLEKKKSGVWDNKKNLFRYFVFLLFLEMVVRLSLLSGIHEYLLFGELQPIGGCH